MKPPSSKHFLREELDIEELTKILNSVTIGDAERAKLMAALETLLFITQELEKKRVSLGRLKKMLFGDTSEKTRIVLEKVLKTIDSVEKDGIPNDDAGSIRDKNNKRKISGHGRNSASAYSGADTVQVPHETLKPKDACPSCENGKLYEYEKKALVRLKGGTPITSTVFQIDRLRCNMCGEIFSALTPDGVGEEKYDASSGSMIALLKYGAGMPFNRLEQLQSGLGIPLPSSTQWDIVQSAARKVEPVFKALVTQAAQGDVLHNDDTTMKILELTGAGKTVLQGGKPGRTGVFTSGIVSLSEGHRIALFFTGRKHAGENIADILKQRLTGRPPPIQMCDALSRNIPKGMETILANCLSHGRRQFVDVVGSFPDEVIHVLKLFKEVYIADDIARAQEMSPEERLQFHQQHSKPWMDKIEQWCRTQLEDRKVEPNSSLGGAISYMLKHWDALTLFLREGGAPLDNNICERALKKAIMNRKNAYFYKTMKGAEVGDLFMSLIHSCELCHGNPFDYLCALQKYSAQLKDTPERWLPWNYQETRSLIQAVDIRSVGIP